LYFRKDLKICEFYINKRLLILLGHQILMKYTSVYEFEISRFLRQKLKTLEEYSLTIS